MNAVARLIITILFGLFGIYKFIDKKPMQGLVYLCTFGLFSFGWIIDIVSSIQFLKKIQIKKIENTSRVLGVIFALILLSYCFGSLGTEDFSTASFIICLVSGIALIKIFVIDNNKHNLSYANIDKTHFNQNNAINNVQKSVTTEPGNIRLSIGTESYNDYDLKNTKVKYLTGKFYDENNIILDKYINLKYYMSKIEQYIDTKDLNEYKYFQLNGQRKGLMIKRIFNKEINRNQTTVDLINIEGALEKSILDITTIKNKHKAGIKEDVKEVGVEQGDMLAYLNN